jgi:hypothetical protein
VSNLDGWPAIELTAACVMSAQPNAGGESCTSAGAKVRDRCTGVDTPDR